MGWKLAEKIQLSMNVCACHNVRLLTAWCICGPSHIGPYGSPIATQWEWILIEILLALKHGVISLLVRPILDRVVHAFVTCLA